MIALHLIANREQCTSHLRAFAGHMWSNCRPDVAEEEFWPVLLPMDTCSATEERSILDMPTYTRKQRCAPTTS
jgi:hypothetical protein